MKISISDWNVTNKRVKFLNQKLNVRNCNQNASNYIEKKNVDKELYIAEFLHKLNEMCTICQTEILKSRQEMELAKYVN